MQKLEMTQCFKCGNDYPMKRKELGYNVCLNCSTVDKVVGITTVEGTGDHTYNDLIIMDRSKAIRIAQLEARMTGRSVGTAPEILSSEDEVQPSTEWKTKTDPYSVIDEK